MIKSPAFTPLAPEQFEQRKAAQIKALLTRQTDGGLGSNRQPPIANAQPPIANAQSPDANGKSS